VGFNKDYDWNAQATRAGYMEIYANAMPDAAVFGAINIVPNGTMHSCNPGANIKRSEVAAILTRMMNESARISFSM
jgi:hypothetical protein